LTLGDLIQMASIQPSYLVAVAKCHVFCV
jgi:hypothetical protein